MTDAATRAAELLSEHRRSIDNLDAILVHALAERFRRTQLVGELKAAHALPAAGSRHYQGSRTCVTCVGV